MVSIMIHGEDIDSLVKMLFGDDEPDTEDVEKNKPEEEEQEEERKEAEEPEEQGAKVKKVFICSPFRPDGETDEEQDADLVRNISLAWHAARYAMVKGCIPYAPHLYFPQFLSDSDNSERRTGIQAGLFWLKECDELWIIGEKVTEGMEREIEQAEEWGIPVKQVVDRITGEDRLLCDIFGVEKIYGSEMPEEMDRVSKADERNGLLKLEMMLGRDR